LPRRPGESVHGLTPAFPGVPPGSSGLQPGDDPLLAATLHPHGHDPYATAGDVFGEGADLGDPRGRFAQPDPQKMLPVTGRPPRGAALEEDEELAYDTAAPRRNAATLAALRAADRVLAGSSADPVGISRLIRELPRLAPVLQLDPDTADPARGLVVANRLREGLLAGNPAARSNRLTRGTLAAPLFATVPMDVAAADAAHGRGQLLSEAAPGSPLFAACAELADAAAPRPGRRREGPRQASGRMPGRRRRGNAGEGLVAS
jgi:hypothetical protein